MKISIEISLYPLDKNYSQAIREFIARVSQYQQVEIRYQPMSTQITGEFDLCMELLNAELKHSFDQNKTIASVIKIINLDMTDT
ncbi:MAG: thiamine-binding protein [Saprospiraceae bacterium]|nr:thiamine-binding protein [Saprospiraceae bacterium]